MRGTRYCFAIVLAMSVGAACIPPPAPIPQADLRFFHLGQLIFSHSVAGPATLNATSLLSVPNDPLFPNPIGGVDVDVYSANASHATVSGTNLVQPGIEVDLYAENLVATNSYLASIPVAVETPAQPVWADATSTTQMPQSIGLPYPPNSGWNLTQRYGLRPIQSSYFWNTSSPAAPPDANIGEPGAWNPAPPGIGSVKSARIYDPGLCSIDLPFHTTDNQGVYDQLNVKLVDYLASNGGSLDYSFFTTLLDDGLMFVGNRNTPRGGFFWYVWFAEINKYFNGDISASLELAANVSYEYRLDNGVLAISATENQTPLVEPQIGFSKIKDLLECEGPPSNCQLGDQTVPQLFEAGTLSQQTIVLTNTPCLNGDPTTALITLGALASDGANSMGGDGTTVASTIRNQSNWTCNSDNLLTFVTRAKRINVYGDAVELVWFDQADPNDFTYAIYSLLVGAQLHGIPGVPGPSSLCNRRLPNVGFNILQPPTVHNPPFVSRNIITVSEFGSATGGASPNGASQLNSNVTTTTTQQPGHTGCDDDDKRKHH